MGVVSSRYSPVVKTADIVGRVTPIETRLSGHGEVAISIFKKGISMTTSLGRCGLALLFCTLSVLFSFPAAAQATAAMESAYAAAQVVAQEGPQDIPLASQAILKLPIGRMFIPQPEAGSLLRAMGNPGSDPDLHGLIFPSGDKQDWFITVRYKRAGYVKDSDAKDWKADELLDSIKRGTEESNKQRVQLGIAAIDVVGWSEPPAYDANNHRLVWAIAAKDRGAAAGAPQSVNYNTYALGRDGYFSLNLVTNLKDLSYYKYDAKAMLAALKYNDGKRYADFNASTDRVAEYGLAALVAGIGAKKLGLFGIIGVFLAKCFKMILVVLAVLGVGLIKFFKRD
jgi:uncharacterized membrane-anchored protein